MLLTIHSLFPQVHQFTEINLNDWLAAHCTARPEGAEAYQREIDRMNDAVGTATYGGWMEWREWMWSGSYMDAEGNFAHLGVDVYLPQSTPVQLPFASTVLDTFYDEDCEVGWGGRITVQRDADHPAIVLGHLEVDFPPVGSVIPAHTPIGHLATWPVNGNVFEHLHIQLVAPGLVSRLDWHQLDGYGLPDEAGDFPHPFRTEV